MGSPGFVWTDEPHDPTSFTLILLLAVAERQRWRTQYDQGQNRGRCCGQCFGNGDRVRGRPHQRTGKKGEESREGGGRKVEERGLRADGGPHSGRGGESPATDRPTRKDIDHEDVHDD